MVVAFRAILRALALRRGPCVHTVVEEEVAMAAVVAIHAQPKFVVTSNADDVIEVPTAGSSTLGQADRAVAAVVAVVSNHTGIQ